MVLFYCCMIPGVAIDSADGENVSIIKKSGKVQALQDEIYSRKYIV